MSRPLGPRRTLGGSTGAGGWIVLAGCWLAAAVVGLLPLPILIAGVVLAAVAVAVWTLTRTRPDDPVTALSGNLPARLTAPRVVTRAVQLRPSLHTKKPGARDIGLLLGDQQRRRGARNPTVFATWEDTVLAFMAPRSGKTTSQAIPFTLSAPGPVIATSNKADLWAATAELRGTGGRRTWLFDPNHITHQDQQWWWDPLGDLGTVEEAHRLAGHFVLTVDDGTRRDLWGPAAQDLLCALFLAAASSGRSLRQVSDWLDEPSQPYPCDLLTAAGFPLIASSLRGTQAGAVETRDGIYQTARTAAKAMRDEQILGWVTPGDAPDFDPHGFARSGDTLYLLSKSRSAAAPLIAALTDTVMRAAEEQAERRGGRLDPPLVVVLDEAANICRIADLPDLYSHLGSRGIVPVTILQSYEQGVAVWGEHGMGALWGAGTVKVIGAGLDSPRLVRDLATLVGQHDVAVSSLGYGDGRSSEQVSLRRQDILDPAAIRSLCPGSALLLATGAKPALLTLRPWYDEPSAAAIAKCVATAEATIAAAADRAARSGGRDR